MRGQSVWKLKATEILFWRKMVICLMIWVAVWLFCSPGEVSRLAQYINNKRRKLITKMAHVQCLHNKDLRVCRQVINYQQNGCMCTQTGIKPEASSWPNILQVHDREEVTDIFWQSRTTDARTDWHIDLSYKWLIKDRLTHSPNLTNGW